MATRTIKQALIDEVFYPLPDGKVDNVLLSRGIKGNDEVSRDVLNSDAFKGALADCLAAVVEQALNFSEADKSVAIPSESQIVLMKKRVNALYKAIGEQAADLGEPTVTFGL